MKSIVCKEPYKMEIFNAEDIGTVAEDEVVINIKRIGICGTDSHAYKGNQPFFTYPRVLGHELSGRVHTIGNQVDHIAPGDIVSVIPYIHCGECVSCSNGQTNCCTNMKVLGVHEDGGMSEYIKVHADNVMVVNDLSLDEASIVEPLSIGAHAVKRAGIDVGETVLIIGAGPIGLGTARFAKLSGAKTIIMDLDEDRLDFCQKWAKCDAAIQASDDSFQQLLNENNGVLPNTVLDATGNKQSMNEAFQYVSHGGKLVYVGLVKDSLHFYDPDFHTKELTLLASRNALRKDFEYVIHCMNQGLIYRSYITQTIPFAEVPSFFSEGDFNSNKTVISLEPF
ncbi:zinc-binding alcohol dehydrogenase family protein [Salibacterium halotolerans]|uniref:2-desacetyl-2-hydroxyethyl bacteriochlorophyllide A dehydrogenase n=1 Tax=Salibacterium halotolerans TaxID=1884432 RepID=A0A1I5KXS2_9BACI|nr:zinc-binding alcohol dehydrogenase family protein [Salibacterium halotolerans]SFO89436.1 hypothetical protein SAMN05518683_10114 [Salibacterium halotolerans]